jgi:hypothetical protein
MRRIVIGGLPAPIGGVTVFLHRLLCRDAGQIDHFLDFYPGPKAPLPAACRDKVIFLRGPLALWLWLWRNRAAQIGREVFFNFSTSRALLFTALVPKPAGARWSLLLHHGTLRAGGRLRRVCFALALSRFDEIRCLNPAQVAFFTALAVPRDACVAEDGYCPPLDHRDDPVALARVADLRGRYRHLVLMSGSGTRLYNFDLGVQAVAGVSTGRVGLCLFLYGQGGVPADLRSLAARHDWLHLFHDESEAVFNTVLRRADAYLRLTATDSFGLAAWDAAQWKVPVIATAAPRRPPGAVIVPLEAAAVTAALAKALAAGPPT